MWSPARVFLAAASLMLVSPGCADRPSRASRALADAGARGVMGAPFVMTLQGDKTSKDRTMLRATLALTAPASSPIVWRVRLPEGAKLVGGAQRELVPTGTRGELVRRWTIAGPAAGTRVIAIQQDGWLRGARADLTYPAAAEASAPRFSTIAPVRLGGVPVQAAIALPPSPTTGQVTP